MAAHAWTPSVGEVDAPRNLMRGLPVNLEAPGLVRDHVSEKLGEE